jgi:hypothetical protein
VPSVPWAASLATIPLVCHHVAHTLTADQRNQEAEMQEQILERTRPEISPKRNQRANDEEEPNAVRKATQELHRRPSHLAPNAIMRSLSVGGDGIARSYDDAAATGPVWVGRALVRAWSAPGPGVVRYRSECRKRGKLRSRRHLRESDPVRRKKHIGVPKTGGGS